MHLTSEPSKKNIIEAHERIEKYIHKTPILSSQLIDKIFGANIYFKCENFQKVGAFKFRGASNAVLSLSAKELSSGIATHSSGNHAAAVALAGKMNKTTAYIVMPSNAPKIKIAAVREYGGKITFCDPTLKAREETLDKIVKQTGAAFIHPYNNYDVIAGQASCAKEILHELDNLDYIIAPVGGGGLLSGTALSAYYFGKNVKVIAGEPSGADDAFRSLRDNKIYPSINPKTIADGLLTCLSEKTFAIIKKYVSKIITVSETEIIQSMRLIWERMKIIVEPSSAVTLAVIIKNKNMFANKNIVLIISGGNVDLTNLPF